MALSDYKTALVTGASAGIGAATVRSLCAAGITVYAAARRLERLEALATETGCIPLVLDVLDTDKIYAELGDIDIDIVVNNAGLGRAFDGFETITPADIDLTIQTNVLAAMHVVRAVTPGMTARQRGHIVNIGSVAGLYPVNSIVYGASKGAVHLMSQNMRVELAGSGIRVTEVCPGRVGTEFFESAFADEEMRKSFAKGYSILTPTDVANSISFALDTPWHVNIGLIEMTPLEQHLGGGKITPAEHK